MDARVACSEALWKTLAGRVRLERAGGRGESVALCVLCELAASGYGPAQLERLSAERLGLRAVKLLALPASVGREGLIQTREQIGSVPARGCVRGSVRARAQAAHGRALQCALGVEVVVVQAGQERGRRVGGGEEAGDVVVCERAAAEARVGLE